MKLISALQDWYSACYDEKLREFENRCLDDIAYRLSEQDRRVLSRQRKKINRVASSFPYSKELAVFDCELNECFHDEDGRMRNGNGILARMEYSFPGVPSVFVEVGVVNGQLDGFVMSRRMTWRERREADCELVSILLYPPAPPLPPDIDALMAHRAELKAASDGLITICDPAARELCCAIDRWSWHLGEIKSQYCLLQDATAEGKVRLHDYIGHEQPAECRCAIPLLKWAAAHLDYLDQPEIDKIARAVALLPDTSGAKVTPLVES